jgi:ABC-2 type transport system permease protein
VENELTAVIYKEWHEIVQENGSSKGSWLRLAMLAALGLAVGWQAGPAIATGPILPLFGGFLGFTLTIPPAADSFAGERERHTLESLFATPLSDAALVLGKLAACVLVALIAVAVFIVLAVLAALAKSGGDVLHQSAMGPPVLETFLLALVAALVIGAVGLQVSLRASSVRNALQGMTFTLLVLVGVPRLIAGLTSWSARSVVIKVADQFGAQAVGALMVLVVLAVIVAATVIDIRVCRSVRLRGRS